MTEHDITVRQPIQWECAAATSAGSVRTVNEDAVLARPEVGLWAVADGMGGHEGGSVASGMIVEALAALARPALLTDFVCALQHEIVRVNGDLLDYAETTLAGRVIGSTFVSLIIHGQLGVYSWMGDSRLYRYRGKTLTPLTRDHSRVAELLEQGEITAEEAQGHPESNVITRAVGTSAEPCIDTDTVHVQVGDVFLLCSDGLYNAVEEPHIAACLEGGTAQDCVQALIDHALDNGARDNVSVIVVRGLRGERHAACDEAVEAAP